jgi:hypothetical protein
MSIYKGSYVFIEGTDKLELFETKNVRNLYINPITNQLFNDEQLQYIQCMYECYNEFQHIEITKSFVSSLVDWYDDIRRNVPFEKVKTQYPDAYKLVKYFTTIDDFQSHFIDFASKYTELEENKHVKHERWMVEKSLLDSGITGKWFLRHSSKNRTETSPSWVTFYALSFIDKDKKIKHVLLKHHIGCGWTFKREIWYATFIDMLEDILLKYNLPYDKQISKNI